MSETGAGRCAVCVFQVAVTVSAAYHEGDAKKYTQRVLQAHLDERHPTLNLKVVG